MKQEVSLERLKRYYQPMFDMSTDHFEWLAELCNKAEGVEHDLLWGNELVFRCGNEMFCLFRLERNRKVAVTFRPHPEKRDELLKHPAIQPAAFPADGGWLFVPETALAMPASNDGVSRDALSDWVKTSYELARAAQG